MAALPLKLLSEEEFIRNLKKTIKLEIEKGLVGTDLQVLYRILIPDPSVFNSQCKKVEDDLRSCLESLDIERIELFGSSVGGIVFNGL